MSKKILIADDATPIRTILRRQLTRLCADWEILEAAEGGSILDTYFEHEPEYILLDVEIPEADGWEILSTIRDFDQRTNIIMITASESPEDVVKALELGADGFIGKPFDIYELGDALNVQQSRLPLSA